METISLFTGYRKSTFSSSKEKNRKEDAGRQEPWEACEYIHAHMLWGSLPNSLLWTGRIVG